MTDKRENTQTDSPERAMQRRDYTVAELIAGLKRLIEANGKEMDHYNSRAMETMDVLQRSATIKAIAADNRWIHFVLYNIEQGAKFLAQNDKGAVTR